MACPMGYSATAQLNEKNLSQQSSFVDSHDYVNLPLTPPDDLECLQPNYNPKHIQKIASEGILIAGGALAILLQVANPGVAAGVNENSNFAYRPTDRLRTTMTFVYCMAFGTVKEKKTIIEMVHRAHVPVRGLNGVYAADDPELQLWVAATLYATAIDIYEKVFGTLGPEEAEAVYREYHVMATCLRVPHDMWPKDRAAFWEYWDHKVETLEITEHGRIVAHDLLYNKKLPLFLRMGLPGVRIATAEWLPPRMRAEFGLKTNSVSRGLYRIGMGHTRIIYPLVPKFIRHLPLHYYMRDMRKRMARMEGASKV